ncbi:MAG: C40 family peptidase [Nodosilinea sp. LVE1205-7]
MSPLSGPEYRCLRTINLYQTADLKELVTQAGVGRQLQLISKPQSAAQTALSVRLCEDGYPGWIALADFKALELAPTAYQPPSLTRSAIHSRLPQAIAFAQQAMAQPNTYLWGGTVGPNFDCSGLVQTAFAAAGIRLPRDSYQQEAFTVAIAWTDLEAGDLIFFGTPERTKHVALYLGKGLYIHSSGVDQGRNGIGIDSLTDLSDPISQAYHQQLRRPGRVMASYRTKAEVIDSATENNGQD